MAGTLPAARAQLRDLTLARGRAHEDPDDVAAPPEAHRAHADAVVAAAVAHAALDRAHELASPGAAPQLDLHPSFFAQPVGDHERASGHSAEARAVEPERAQRR